MDNTQEYTASSSTIHMPWVIWVYPASITKAFNIAPRIEITRELRTLGWKVDYIAVGPSGKHSVQGVEVLCYPYPDTYIIGNIIFHLRTLRYIQKSWEQVNVVLFSQSSFPWMLLLRFLRILSKCQPIFVLDTRTVPMEPKKKATIKDKLRAGYLLLMNWLANHFADGQTAITQRMADYLGIPPKQLWGTWPSGVNLSKFTNSTIIRQWPQKAEPIVVSYIGTLNHERNLATLCKAILDANSQGCKFKLVLYGEGNAKKELENFANQTNNVIHVFGAIPNEQIPESLARAHIGALPFPDEDKFRVSSPIKLFEYMGAGMPILATKIVCHTDVIGDGDYVFWANNANVDGILNALHQIWNNRKYLPDLGKKALAAAQDWTWLASAQRLDKALQHGLFLRK